MSHQARGADRRVGMHECWDFDESTGFLIAPDPVSNLRVVETGLSADDAGVAQELGELLPPLIQNGRLRTTLDDIPVISMAPAVGHGDGRVLERLVQIYSHLANAYVWCDQSDPSHHLPEGVAVPLVELSRAVGRPPVMAYASTALANFERIDPAGDLSVGNL